MVKCSNYENPYPTFENTLNTGSSFTTKQELIVTKITYKECFAQIKDVLCHVLDKNLNPENFTASQHYEIFGTLLTRYFQSEAIKDLFDGFLRLIVYLYNWVVENFNLKEEALLFTTQILRKFFAHINRLDEKERKKLLKNSNLVCNVVYVSF